MRNDQEAVRHTTLGIFNPPLYLPSGSLPFIFARMLACLTTIPRCGLVWGDEDELTGLDVDNSGSEDEEETSQPSQSKVHCQPA